MNPLIINFKEYRSKEALNEQFGQAWVYVGRGNPYYNLDHSPLANPYSHKSGNKAIKVSSAREAVDKYKKWLWAKMKARDPKVMGALNEIHAHSVLVCWCDADAPCHAKVIRDAVGYLKESIESG